MSKILGRINRATFGFGGYDGAMFGITVDLRSEATGVGDFNGTWADPPSPHAKWTVEDQSKHFSDCCRLLIRTLREAKKQHVGQLVGTPVEITLDNNSLKSWRVLTEVIG